MGKYGTEKGPSKVTRHFSHLIDGKLPCSLFCSGNWYLLVGRLNYQMKNLPN